MRVALFFDGKNHTKDLRLVAGERWVDHAAMARVVVEKVGGTELVAAHYYTGTPSGPDDSGRSALNFLLGELERVPGFFVHRFPRYAASWPCSACGHEEQFTREKLVDTQLVADVVREAAQGLWDVAVVFSGDLDLMPALSGARAFGKRAWLATFGRHDLGRDLVREAWGVLDLREVLGEILSDLPSLDGDGVGELGDVDRITLHEILRGQQHFERSGGFLGTQFFLHRWRGPGLPDDHEARRRSVERLMKAGRVEILERNGRSSLMVLEEGEE